MIHSPIHVWVLKNGRSYMTIHSHISCWIPAGAPGTSKRPRLLALHLLRSLVAKQRQRWNRWKMPLRRPKFVHKGLGFFPLEMFMMCATLAYWCLKDGPPTILANLGPNGMKVMYVVIAGVWHTVAFFDPPAFLQIACGGNEKNSCPEFGTCKKKVLKQLGAQFQNKS